MAGLGNFLFPGFALLAPSDQSVVFVEKIFAFMRDFCDFVSGLPAA